jgi:hypothetical protein
MKRMIFIGVGVLVILAALVWAVSTYQFINQAATAQGEVIKLNSGGSHPEIKFTLPDGQEIEYPQSGLIFGYKVGDKVEILYDAKNPKNASLNTFGALWGFPVLILTLGLIFVIVGIFQ